jgi:hypothetical protein
VVSKFRQSRPNVNAHGLSGDHLKRIGHTQFVSQDSEIVIAFAIISR